MKLLLHLTSFLLGLSLIQAQSEAYAIIDANHIRASLASDGTLFCSYANGNCDGFIGPDIYNCGGETIAQAGLWITATDSEDGIYASANANGWYSMTHGFIDINTGQTSEHQLLSQDRVWNIKKRDILKIKESIFGAPSHIAQDILEWPARGNPFYGDLLLTIDAAPFFDNNGDNLYNPMDGDYPMIGEGVTDATPDQILLSVANDSKLDIFSELQVDIFTMLYVFNCDSSLQRTLFQRQIIYNRSSTAYDSLRVGHMIDPDFSYGDGDYFGSSPDKDLFYFYAGDSSIDNVVYQFSHSPVHVCNVLNGELDRFMYLSRPDLVPEGIPPFAYYFDNEINQFLNGYWIDSIPLTYGGMGYDLESTEATNFAFSGDPSDQDSWSIINEDFVLYDARVFAIQEFDTFLPGRSVTLDLMHTFFQDVSYDHIESIDAAITQALANEQLVSEDFEEYCDSYEPCNIMDCVLPGDVNNNEIVDRTDFMLFALAKQKAQGTQSKREYPSIIFEQTYANDRSETFENGTNYKHADCNGNGTIDDYDFNAFRKHFARKSPLFEEYNEPCEPYSGEGEIKINFHSNFPSEQITDIVNAKIEFLDFKDIHGVSFKIDYDTTYFEKALGSTFGPLESSFESITFANKDHKDQDLIVVTADIPSNINFDTLRIGVWLRLKEDVGAQEFELVVEDILLSDFDERFYCMESVSSAEVLLTDIDDLDSENILIYPNPATDLIMIEGADRIAQVQIIDQMGRVQRQMQSPFDNTLNIQGLRGVFLVSVILDDGKIRVEKVVIN